MQKDWVGQSGVLALWGVVAVPGPLGHLTSICDRGVNLSYLFIYVFIWNIYTGWLSGSAPGPLGHLASIRE